MIRLSSLHVGDSVWNKYGVERKVLGKVGDLISVSTKDDLEAHHKWYTVHELNKFEYTLEAPEVDDDDEVETLTMDEIAEKFGIPVENLRIEKE